MKSATARVSVRSGPRILKRPATFLGTRQNLGVLWLVMDPYEYGTVPPPIRLAVADEEGMAFRIWYVDSAPRWAQAFYRQHQKGVE